MGGSLLQLVAKGAQDTFITAYPEITFFRTIYRRHTNFAIETIEQHFKGNVQFGSKTELVISRQADLISNVMLYIELPALPQDEERGVKRSWVNSIGHALILCSEIKIGSEMIDRQTGEWLEIWSELTMKEEKRQGYYEMIGKINNNATTLGKRSHSGPMCLYVPLNYWFCRNLGLSLPLIALQYHEVRVCVDFRKLSECYITNLDCDNDILDLSLRASLLVDYIYLDNKERHSFGSQGLTYLIEQVQCNEGFSVNGRQTIATIPIDFNHPVKELIWVVQRSDVHVKSIDNVDYVNGEEVANPVYGNDWFNFSSTLGVPLVKKEAFTEAKIRFNSIDRTPFIKANYFRLVQPFKKHTRVPGKYIYVYGFGFLPEEYQPTGTANFSRIDHPKLHLKFKGTVPENRIVKVYAVSYNVIKFVGGMGGVMFQN
jgi:hypothetical protein